MEPNNSGLMDDNNPVKPRADFSSGDKSASEERGKIPESEKSSAKNPVEEKSLSDEGGLVETGKRILGEKSIAGAAEKKSDGGT